MTDLTGFATVALAAGTAYLAWTTRRVAEATTSEAVATTEQVRRAHRPVVVPIAESGASVLVEGRNLSGVPQIHDNHFVLPLRNIGMGPALNVQASANILATQEPVIAKDKLAALGVGRDGALRLGPPEREVGATAGFPFSARLTYEDVAGKEYTTTVDYTFANHPHITLIAH